jgi:hypothetical protein
MHVKHLFISISMLFVLLVIAIGLQTYDVKPSLPTALYSTYPFHSLNSSDFKYTYQVTDRTLDRAKAFEYVSTLYNAHYGLVKESNHIDKYWLWSDNVLAAEIFRNHNSTLYTNITDTLRNYASKDHIIFASAWAPLSSQASAILQKRISFGSPIDKNLIDNIWYTEYSSNDELKCSDYADIAFLESIYLYEINRLADSKTCYDQGSNMFDGVGFEDKAFNSSSDHPYSTYKLALWKIASDITGFGGSGESLDLESLIAGMQDTRTGGVSTYYNWNFTPNYQTNAETSILAIMASSRL